MLHVLCYHKIANILPSSDRWNLTLSQDIFIDQIRSLASCKRFLNLAETDVREAVYDRHDWVLITFDDIYFDVIKLALPILEEHSASALLFIASGFLGRPSFWWDDVEVMFSCQPPEERARSIDSMWEWLRDRPLHDKYSILSHVKYLSKGQMAEPVCRPASQAELKDIANKPYVHFGGHTVTHPCLPSLPIDTIVAEVSRGSEALQQITGKTPKAFAYPYGAYDKKTRNIVSELGYELAFTTEEPSRRNGSATNFDLLAYPRLCVECWSGEELLSRLEKI